MDISYETNRLHAAYLELDNIGIEIRCLLEGKRVTALKRSMVLDRVDVLLMKAHNKTMEVERIKQRIDEAA